MTLKLGILSTHPIQYYSPLYQELSRRLGIDLTVYYAYRATPRNQAAAGFGVEFEWDIPLLEGYRYEFLPNVAREPSSSTYRGCDTPAIADIIQRERFDAFLVHGWYTRSYWQAMRTCWRTGTPLMVRGDSTLLMQTSRLRRLAKWVTHRCFVPRFDAYLVVGQRAREYYLAYGADPKRMVWCPHFVDNDRFANAAAAARQQRDTLRQQWGLPTNATVVLFAGKFITKKRPLDFVRAIAGSGTTLAGLMVGDGPLRNEIETTIAQLNAPIRLTGFLNQSQMASAYAAADALVLLSEGTETWGLVVNEAMACGLPAIVSDRVGCAPDLVIPNETGYIYPMGDVAKLADCLKRIAEPDVARVLGAAAQRRVGFYTVRAAADGVVQAMERVRTIRQRT
jgi:glycosyltransferase involved in cell wall biosynthesis